MFSFLSLKAKQLSNEYDHSRKMALHEMKQYVSSQLKTVVARKRALAMHIAGCEAVITAIGSRSTFKPDDYFTRFVIDYTFISVALNVIADLRVCKIWSRTC